MTIKNLHQRKITAARLAEFEDRLRTLREQPAASDDRLRKAAIAQHEDRITEFEADLAAFDALSSAGTIDVRGVEDLGPALIRARIASSLTQAQLAERTGLHTAAINRYEANDYRSASLDRIAAIAQALDFDLTASFVRTV